jgi:hypothetical protein
MSKHWSKEQREKYRSTIAGRSNGTTEPRPTVTVDREQFERMAEFVWARMSNQERLALIVKLA